MAGSLEQEQEQLWTIFDSACAPLTRDQGSTANGPTARWLRTNLQNEILAGTWDANAAGVYVCVVKAARAAVALQPILSPNSAVVGEKLLAAAVYAVKAYLEGGEIRTEGVICV